MNRTPSILVNTGFPVDQNGALTELDFPNVVTTLDAPKKIAFPGTSINWIPSTASNLEEIDAPNATSLPANAFKSYTHLTRANLPSIVNLSSSGNNTGQFSDCVNLTTVNLPNVISISCSNLSGTANSTTSGAFVGCTSLTAISLPALTTLNNTASNCRAGAFINCTSLTTVNFPSFNKDSSYNGYASNFYRCTSLTTVQLGSEGHAVTSLGQYMFSDCTQANLTITIYTSGGAALSGSPWGATNATIVYEEA